MSILSNIQNVDITVLKNKELVELFNSIVEKLNTLDDVKLNPVKRFPSSAVAVTRTQVVLDLYNANFEKPNSKIDDIITIDSKDDVKTEISEPEVKKVKSNKSKGLSFKFTKLIEDEEVIDVVSWSKVKISDIKNCLSYELLGEPSEKQSEWIVEAKKDKKITSRKGLTFTLGKLESNGIWSYSDVKYSESKLSDFENANTIRANGDMTEKQSEWLSKYNSKMI